MDPQQLVEQIIARKWVAVAALLIGFIVRLLKSDTKIPITLPPWARSWTAIALGGTAGALDKLANMKDVTWTTALLEGLTAAVVAMVMHSLVIESVRGGKEIVVPGLIKENTPPGPGKPPSIPPTAGNEKTMKDVAEGKDVDTSGLVRKLFAPILLAATLLGACHLFTPSELPNTLLTFEQIACIMEHAFIDDKNLNALCNLVSASQQSEARRVAAAHRQAVTRQLASRTPEPVCADGGASDASREGGK